MVPNQPYAPSQQFTAPDGSPVGGDVPLNPGEVALAMWGIHELLGGDHGKHARFGLGKLREMANIEERLQEGANKVAKGHNGKLPFWKPDHDYATMLKRLSQPLGPQELTDIVNRFPPEAHAISGPFLVVAQHAWQYLQDSFPTSRYLTFTGPESMVPDDEKTWSFLTCLHVLQDPFVVYDLIATGALLPSHVMCMRSIYPTLSEHIGTSIYAAVTMAKAEQEKYRMPPDAEMGWATWTGRRVADYRPPEPPAGPNAAAAAASNGPAPSPAASSTAGKGTEARQLRTPSSRAEAAS